MLLFDIETNGLLDTVDKVHCLVIKDTETGEVQSFRPHQIKEGVAVLSSAIANEVTIAGHNIIDYDLPVLSKLGYLEIPRDKRHLVFDTLVVSRLIYSNIEELDYSLIRKDLLPTSLKGSHSLKAWGYRLDNNKGTYGETENAWEEYSEEMLTYCIQDVNLNVCLLEKLLSHNYSPIAITLEHEVQWLMSQQMRNGFNFNIDKAKKLEGELLVHKADINSKLLSIIPQLPDKIFIPKRDNKTKGYKAGVPIQKYKDFNPNSRQQVEYVIRTMYNYSPTNPELYDIPDEVPIEEDMDLSQYHLKIDDVTFEYISKDTEVPDDVRELSAIISEGLMLSKRIGQLSTGKGAWLKFYNEDTKKIHGYINPNGAVTGRATHSSPNIAQVPACDAPYGKECRELFEVPKGWYQVGVDASGLELRCLGHFMSPWDNGRYCDIILNGDIHTENQKSAGLPTRNNAKTFIYGFLYGAGDAKIGKIIHSDATAGRKIKQEFLKKTPAIAQLKQAISDSLAEMYRGRVKRWKRKYLKGLDGRHLHVRSLHSALNLLLQSAGALLCKKWIVLTEERLIKRGLKHSLDGDFFIMAWIHDEVQMACKSEEIAKIVIEEAQQAMRDTQEFFNFRCQLDTEGKIGKNWKECH